MTEDFGRFESEAQPTKESVVDEVPLSQGSDDFGKFDTAEVDKVSSKKSQSEDEGFGDFGDAPEADNKSESGDGFGDFGEDTEAKAASKKSSSEGCFGDFDYPEQKEESDNGFGDFGDAPEAENFADDGFGDFGEEK